MNINRTISAVGSAKRLHSCRLLLGVPPSGFGAQLGVMRAWLDANCGPEGWAWAPAGTGGVVNDALAFYFAHPEQADAFIRRFCCGYRVLLPGVIMD